LASLVADHRPWKNEIEDGRIQAALAKAEKEIVLPERQNALDSLTSCAELVEDIESAWRALSTGGVDIRSKIRPYTTERKARETADKAAKDERLRQLQVVEDNILLKGGV
jgi:hypothetical protein